jgi:hypothetical protein
MATVQSCHWEGVNQSEGIYPRQINSKYCCSRLIFLLLVVVRPTDNSLESVKQKLELLHMNSLEEKFNDQTRSPQDPPRMHLVLQVRKFTLCQNVLWIRIQHFK